MSDCTGFLEFLLLPYSSLVFQRRDEKPRRASGNCMQFLFRILFSFDLFVVHCNNHLVTRKKDCVKTDINLLYVRGILLQFTQSARIVQEANIHEYGNVFFPHRLDKYR